MFAALLDRVGAALRACQAPGEQGAVSGAAGGAGVYEIAAPVDADRCSPDGTGKMQGTRVVRNDECSLGENPGEE